MYITDVIWWVYTALVLLAAVFFVAFVLSVREKGE